MKKIIYALVLVFTLGISTSTVSAADNKKAKTELTADQKVQLDKLMSRVEQIRSMDKSNLNREEKRALRKELKEMKEKANALGQGVYLSVGAIIIIILLLILIL